MHLKSLELQFFKNYKQVKINFDEKLNVILGLNGMGKTNLLDAIYYLCCGKSYFQSSDKILLNEADNFFRLKGIFLRQEKEEIIEGKFGTHRKKELLRNAEKYARIAHHIGQFPVNIIAPDDILIVKGGSENRRRLFDFTFSQISPEYLSDLINYNKVLSQRNAYLKSLKNGPALNRSLLESYDFQLIKYGEAIHAKRQELTTDLLPFFEEMHQSFVHKKETVDLLYSSNLNEKRMGDLLLENRERDVFLQRTTRGVHRDDWAFEMAGQGIRKIGSQGQQKSFLIALKLALSQLLGQKLGVSPVLLLDDIFDKLDAVRIQELLVRVTKMEHSQLFLTDADLERLPKILNGLTLPFKLFIVKNGEIIETE